VKKFLVVAVAAYLLLIAVLTVGYLRRRRENGRQSPSSAVLQGELKATMRDEDAPREIRPSLSLQVNGEREASVPDGAPVWFTVGVSSPDAENEIASARVLGERLARLPQGESGREALAAAYERRRAPEKILLGDASHPWAEAIQLLARDEKGGEKPLGFPAKLLGAGERAAVELDAANSTEANLGTESFAAPSGTYLVVACLGESGSWKGRACSEPVKLTVTETSAPQPPDRQRALDRQGGRFGFVAGSPDTMEKFGRRLAATGPDAVEGHLYLGEAQYRRGRWAEALREFQAARTERARRTGAGSDAQFLDLRISELIAKLNGR